MRRYAEWTKRNSVFLISFAVGVLLATAFLELLPEAIEANGTWPFWVLGTIVVFYLLEHSVIIHSCREPECDVHDISTVSVLGISFHSLIDGLTIGVAFSVSYALGIVASLAVVFHELAEGVFTYTLLIHDDIQKGRAMLYSWLVALATPFGALVFYYILRGTSSGNLMGILLAVAAGSFIYIGASDLVPATHKKQAVWNVFLVFLGVGFVLVINYLAPGM